MKRPNVIMILTDDQGYGDLSCMGATVSRIRISPEAHCSMWACTH